MEDKRKKPVEHARQPWRPSERALDAIEKAIEEGVFDNLPGKGKPLDLSADDNPFVSEDLRLAYRILNNAGVRLPWIEQRKLIDAERADLERQIERHRAWIQGEMTRSQDIPAYLRPSRQARLRSTHDQFINEVSRQIESINRKITLYNLSVPVISAQILPLSRERLLRHLGTIELTNPE